MHFLTQKLLHCCDAFLMRLGSRHCLHDLNDEGSLLVRSHLAKGTDANVSSATARVPKHVPIGVLWHEPQPPQRSPQVALLDV
jgi:hypothetical protein